MKTFFETIAVAFSMFSRVPVPQFDWNERNRKYAMLAFPLVGVVLGAFWVLVAFLCHFFDLPALLTGAFLTALPFLVVGGIHLDGYLDTADALSSHASKEKKLEIMSDPHTGAFAVLHAVLYFILWFAAATVLAENGDTWSFLLVGLCFVLSRTLSGLAVASFPLAKGSGLVKSFADESDKKTVRLGLLVLTALLAVLLIGLDFVIPTPPAGLVAVVAAAAVFGWYRYIAVKHFGGITGDLAGWFLCRCELWMLVAVAIVVAP